MKIAVASDRNQVSQHFGHCEGFLMFDVQNHTVTGRKFVPNPGHRPGFLPVFLYDNGANVIISGGMGGGAVDIFNEKGIQVVTGASGDAETAVKNFVEGSLKSSGSICHEHEHADECNG